MLVPFKQKRPRKITYVDAISSEERLKASIIAIRIKYTTGNTLRFEKHRLTFRPFYILKLAAFEHYKIEAKLQNPFIEYSRYVLGNGSESERIAFANGIKTKLSIRSGALCILLQ